MNVSIHIRNLLMICLIGSLLWLYNGFLFRASAQAYTDPISANSAESLNLQVERRNAGVWLDWQAAAGAWTGFSVYASVDCQWDNAVLLTAPIFSSTRQEAVDKAEVVHYSLLDDRDTAAQVCSYWVVGTTAEGTNYTFGPTTIEQFFGVYLPIVQR